jgi:hypothetical protein
MKLFTLTAVLTAVILAAGLTLAGARIDPSEAASLGTPRSTPTAPPGGLLPGRSTSTPAPAGTDSAEESTASPDDCTATFPIDSVEAIEFGTTTDTQLRASFGQPVSVAGRPPRMRFEAGECVLLVTLGTTEAEEAELQAYGTLGWALDRYGPPDAAGIAQGNLTLPFADSILLFYADAGIILRFDADLDALDRDTPIDSFTLRPAYTIENQLRRLNAEKIEWQQPAKT